MKYQALTISLLSLFILQGCDIKGAVNPYSYTPESQQQEWIPCKKACATHEFLLPGIDLNDEGCIVNSQILCDEAITLGEIIDYALSYNPKTAETWNITRVKASEYGESLSPYFIQASGQSNFIRQRSQDLFGSEGAITYSTQYGAYIDLSYTILDFGQTRKTSQAALYALFNADWTHNSSIQKTIQTATNDYYNYTYQEQLLTAKNDDVINTETVLTATKEKLHYGLADISDYVQANTKYLSTKLAVVKQQNKKQLSYHQLISEMGIPAHTDIDIQPAPTHTKSYAENFDNVSIDHLIIKAQEHRPDLFAAQENLRSKTATYTATRLQNLPTLTGTFDVGRTYFQQEFVNLNDGYDFTAQINFNIPIFEGFSIENAIKKSRANMNLAQSQLEKLSLSIIKEVADYKRSLQYARESVVFSQQYLESAEEDFSVNLKKYQMGTASILDVISAQTSVSDARAQLADANYQWYTSLANLAYGIGVIMPPSKIKNQDPCETP